ncbi:MAG: DUF4390 domain-containing protein [gamma proteobacterium endosymbiont of Lamellibrachia anaximandri]|nr:DUF4390 domain-containing protein [gamma proteobacterium endosymbiont of Lamellibrachia anaximandri]
MSGARRLLLLLLLTLGASAWSADFTVKEVQIELQDQHYQLSAHIDYQLSEQALEALSNGVPLTLEVHLIVEKTWHRFWEPLPYEGYLRYQIRFLALTGLYRVVDLQSGEEQSFVTREAALRALGEIDELVLVAQAELIYGERYQLRLRAGLDIESLPLPLRPLAYLGIGWKLTTGWIQWPLQP